MIIFSWFFQINLWRICYNESSDRGSRPSESSIEAMECEGQVEILEIPKTLEEKNLTAMFQSEDFQLL